MSFVKAETFHAGNHGQVSQRKLTRLQPARIVLIDCNVLSEEWLAKNVVEALEKILLLGANMSGACPVPLIGIYLLTIYPELILPLSPIRSNFVRLHSALADLLSFLSEHSKLEQAKQAESCVTEGIAEACRQYKRYVGNTPAASMNFNQLEVIVLTTRLANDVRKKFVSLPEQTDLSIIKRIVCASISNAFNEEMPMESPELAPNDSMDEDFSSLVDVLSLEPDLMSLQKFLYSWLSDSISDTEQLQILLPPPSPVDPPLIIKCDLHERIINPIQLPFHDAFSLDVKSNMCKRVFPPASKSLDLHPPVFQLKVLGSMPKNLLCESVLFGHPLLAQPTGCWKLEWDILEKNQELFSSLCSELVSKDHVLLSCLQHQNPASQMMSRTSHLPPTTKVSGRGSKPSGLFILMPSNTSLLIKSIMCGELCLPANPTLSSGRVSDDNQLCIQSSLSKVETLDHFNPFDFQCGLFDALRHISLPKSSGASRRLGQQQQQQQPQQQTKTMLSKKGDRFCVAKPGSRLTARSWTEKASNLHGH